MMGLAQYGRVGAGGNLGDAWAYFINFYDARAKYWRMATVRQEMDKGAQREKIGHKLAAGMKLTFMQFEGFFKAANTREDEISKEIFRQYCFKIIKAFALKYTKLNYTNLAEFMELNRDTVSKYMARDPSTSGPKLKITVLPGMTIHQPGSADHGRRCILVRVVNRGSSKTTITTLAFQAYNSKSDFKHDKPSEQSVVPSPGPGYSNLPRVLDAGEEWGGMVNHDRELLQKARSGILYCSVFHTMSEEPTRERVVVREDMQL